MIYSITYLGKPGTFSTSNVKLVNVKILGLKREGTGYDQVASSPGGRDFTFDVSSGTVSFNAENTFNPGISINGRFYLEKVWVLIKT